MNLQPGQRVLHKEHGEGIVIGLPSDGFVSIFFSIGERRVPVNSISESLSRSEQIIRYVQSEERRKRRAWLAYQSYTLPLIDNAASLTSAKIDLLPHQVVLTHRIATNSPRRFLIADEVGLGKTIETALILRELASRGELNRTLMIVPAGLVNNWHRELNEVFNLDFEIFGSEGDVTDRRSNAFQKHNRLIASIDTLKRKSRIKKLKEAPPWDLVVFDEAHHLTALKNGGKIKKTENYKLGEVMKELSRDLILLSATPHQGDNFRFWMLVQLLNPSLFRDVDDMLENRHRLNEIIFRRTKADACRPDGSTLFARRSVQTESFLMTEEERVFYRELVEYLADGFALANRIGGKGRALGFVMTIFQKIAASSFAAVKRTLQRRLLALTIQEGILHDTNLDIESREISYGEAREIIRKEYNLGSDRMADVEVDHILSDLKRRIIKKMSEDDLLNAAETGASELDMGTVEDTVFTTINYALPEERHRIKYLLSRFPLIQETKVQKLLYALGVLWNNNPNEKIVIFATYLGTVEMLSQEIEKYYPGQGVTVLKGGDHGAKVAAEKRFKRPDGPKVLISTAAGREGINLQFARVLFNFDLPWNPMDIEQRIGRIHRYGQQHTAQVYNLILSDTIEGKIFLLLDEKLKEVARTLGKVDEFGNVAEDLQSQILGQLSEKLNYESLYKNALNDPELKRTKLELEAAMSNSMEARKAVSQLFQDLDRFSLDDYKPIADVHSGLEAILEFIHNALIEENGELKKLDGDLIRITNGSLSDIVFTTNREKSLQYEKIQLLGLDHPIVKNYIDTYKDLEPKELGVVVKSNKDHKGVVSIWYIEAHGEKQDIKSFVIPIASDINGNRKPYLEKFTDGIFKYPITEEKNEYDRTHFLKEIIEPMLQRELLHRGIISKGHDYQTKLIGWIEIV
ncbi:DEAD/DEAH box helicase [Bacillus cereus group sp. BceL221]|uniref:DEAD/DEAH box helicase n=1 Tax=unclassified Bacillus cereus group TaxID=2750818 RepID=UPI0022E26123|nr:MULTISPECIES: SNF2-related protein [unclassified Bacillus cereus group]MDA2196943.1 SNF2-related protein [Bacillus cereus group sp. Bc238]MDA2202680.1 SNF2-related protein [Bacillus cereus group sp. Bc237]